MHLQIKRDGNDLIRESWLIRAGYDPETGVITRPPLRFAFREDGDNYNITRCLTLGVDPFDVSPSDWPSEHTGKPVRGVDAYAFSGLRMGTVTLQAALLYSTASFMECDFDTVIVPNGFASFDDGRPIFDSGSIGELRIAAGVSSLSRWNFAMVYTGGSGMFGDSLCAVGSVTVEAGNPYMKVVDEIVYNTAETEILLAPAGITGNKTLPPTLTGDIGSGMFMRCGELTGITISHAVTALGNYAFQHCSKLQWIRFLDASSFDRCFHAFEGCAALEYAVLPDNFHLARNVSQYTSPTEPGYTAYPRDYFQEAELLFTTTSYTAAGTQYNSLNLGASSITRAYYAYSETAPAEETGRYWHYTAAGDPAPW
jgi:hypothetical protein